MEELRPSKRIRLNERQYSPNNIIDVDQQGDLLLQVGENAMTPLISVSRQLLSSASPVFATMLGPKYAEGQTSHKNESNPLRLPKDDFNSICGLC